jgi:putative FmdB family regulatory protein
MPTYEYVCKQCGHRVEVVQSLSEEPLKACGVCGGELRKVFHPAGVLFKGSGFYSTDNRAKAKDKESTSSDAAQRTSKGKEGVGSTSSSSSGSQSGDSGGSQGSGGSGASGGSEGSQGSGGSGGSKESGGSGGRGASGSGRPAREGTSPQPAKDES